ncbi:hypothetical protein [Oceaniglobus trochenteri]|uniref:hypothetical protein n=1 Tax=Oceaniglobus trochenteri TaxID=2763260 RepID=UPI001CFFDEE1|nr:hypothetical protein [Oceaniglobus trochenteri]
MKFQLVENPKYWWPVTARVPSETMPGTFEVQKLKILFTPMPHDEVVEAQEVYASLKSESERNDHEKAQLRRICSDWADVIDDDKKPVPFTRDRLDAALQQEWFRKGVYAAFGESQNGQEAARGN